MGRIEITFYLRKLPPTGTFIINSALPFICIKLQQREKQQLTSLQNT